MINIEEDFIEFAGNAFKSMGFDDISARLYALIYLEPEDIAMDELSKKTGYSLASISNKLKLLEGIGVLQKTTKPGSKKIFYSMDKDFIKINLRKIETAYQKQILPIKTELPKIIDRYKGSRLSAEEKKKLELIINYHDQTLKLEKVLDELKEQLKKIQKS